jgi:methanogenic corrinoid protein MtbC1
MTREIGNRLRSALADCDREGALSLAATLADRGCEAARVGLDVVGEWIASADVGTAVAGEHPVATANGTEFAAAVLDRLGGCSHAEVVDPLGVVLVGSVVGDAHELAKDLFVHTARCAGFEVIDLGIGVSAAAFAGAVRNHRPAALAILCQLTACAGGVARVIEELGRQRLRSETQVIFAGAGSTPEFAADCGADGFARDARAGVAMLLCRVAR